MPKTKKSPPKGESQATADRPRLGKRAQQGGPDDTPVEKWTAPRAVHQLFRALYALVPVARGAEAMFGKQLRPDEFRRGVAVPLFGEDGNGGLRADLESGLRVCRAVVDAGVRRAAIAARFARPFDSGLRVTATAVECLMETAGHVLELLNCIETGREHDPTVSGRPRATWDEDTVFDICCRIFGEWSEHTHRDGVLPKDWGVFKVELDTEFPSDVECGENTGGLSELPPPAAAIPVVTVVGPVPVGGAGVKKEVKGKNIDARMLNELANNPESHGWSARRWSIRFSCSQGTVKETKTWKERLKAARATAKADRAARGGGGEPRSDRRRGRVG